ncbi:uncharacterized protein EAF02_002303 [Botrytis sinoallii]|uniref:uncharacterized protein n=1 Tax=Botrytis sinoallii TaxID=1463999 RepID=UPI00190129AF|nr:uncharacterized protein EAF02_002303 [Botrytis sinoallii]KAF7889888.1 hypothetical protein EAF02_002303 [Botrytis sinoallii]
MKFATSVMLYLASAMVVFAAPVPSDAVKAPKEYLGGFFKRDAEKAPEDYLGGFFKRDA